MAYKALIEIDGMMEEVNKVDYDNSQKLPQEQPEEGADGEAAQEMAPEQD